MVICLHCALTGRIQVLHTEVWFVQHGRHEDVTRYWECRACGNTGSAAVA